MNLKDIAKFDPDLIVINQQNLPKESSLRKIDNEVLQMRAKLCLMFTQKWMEVACLINVAELYEE